MYSNIAVLVFGVIFFSIFVLFFVGLVIFQGFGLYRMSKNAGLYHPWLSFFYPLYNMSLLAQRSLYFHVGKNRNLARWSIWLLVIVVIFAVIIGSLVGILMAQGALPSDLFSYYYDQYSDSDFNYHGYGPTSSNFTIAPFVTLLFMIFLLILISFAAAIFTYYVMYYIYKDYYPGNECVMLLISILLGAWPIIFLLIQNVVPVSVAGRYPYGQPKYGRVNSAPYYSMPLFISQQPVPENKDSNKGDTP